MSTTRNDRKKSEIVQTVKHKGYRNRVSRTTEE